MNYEFTDFVGNLGVILILLSYLLLQVERLTSHSLGYLLMNLIGALFILYSLIFDFNLSAAIIEAAWVLISVIGLARWWQKR